MTAPDARQPDELRGQLLGAICRCLGEDPATADPAEVDDLMRHLIPEVLTYAEQQARERAAEEIERLADERVWVTQHDNEVVSAIDLYEQVARLRGELEPVTYDFPPDDAAALPAAGQPRPDDGEGRA